MFFRTVFVSDIHPMARKLMLVNALRSIGQGMLVVVLVLYLAELGWDSVTIGAVLTAGGLLSVMLAPFIGIISDRFGRKPFVICSELLTALCAVVGIVTTNGVLLFLAIALAGFGKADAGSSSPFAPAEQAWLASFIKSSDRGKIYSFHNALSFFGLATGALFVGAMSFETTYFGISSYQVPFYIVLFLSLLSPIILWTITDNRKKSTTIVKIDEELEKGIAKKENAAVWKLAGINVLNAIAIG